MSERCDVCGRIGRMIHDRWVCHVLTVCRSCLWVLRKAERNPIEWAMSKPVRP